MLGLPRCFTFGGLRVDAAIARELLRAVEPMAIEAAVEAERRYMEGRTEQRRIVELELQQARYEASLAERRNVYRCLRKGGTMSASSQRNAGPARPGCCREPGDRRQGTAAARPIG